MGLVTEDAVRTLAGFKGTEAPVVSVYLDVDGRRNPRHLDYEQALAQLVRRAPVGAHPGISEDLRKIDSHVRGGVDRSRTRGLALFSCVAHEFWEAWHLAVPVRNQLVINHTPHVRQLEAVVHNNERFGVLVADRQRARMFVFEQGELVERNELFDRLPRHDDDRGDWDRDHVRDHAAALAHAHIRRAGQVAFAVYQERPFDHLIIGAPAELAPEVEHELHSYLRERIAARINLSTSASDAEIRRAAMDVDERIERDRQESYVTRLRERAGAGNGATLGLDGVLGALNDRRVDTLIVSEGFVAPGWRCPGCDHLAAKGPRCPACKGDMEKVDDVVEEGVEIALATSARVVTCQDNADLDVHGRIGAFLRF